MTIEIRITADTAEEARSQMATLLGGPAQIVGAPDVPLAEAPKRTRAVKPDPAPAETPPADSAAQMTNDQAAPSEPDADGVYDYATQVKPAVLKVSQKHGREGVENLLKPFNVTNAQQIPAERHGELMAAIDKLLEE